MRGCVRCVGQRLRTCIHVCEADRQLCWRTIVPAHCANIDRQQVSQSQRRARKKEKKRTNSKEDISLCPCFTVTQSDGNQA